MTEIITAIEKIENYDNGQGWGGYDGYAITTDRQVIRVLISNGQSCCESWGYFSSEDDTEKFVGTILTGISLTDTALRTEDLEKHGAYGLDEGDIMFVNIDTSVGRLQLAVYNAHNGYYGHTVRVESEQLTHEATL